MTNRNKRLNMVQVKSLQLAEARLAEIERAKAAAVESKQPRFAIDRKNINQIFNQIYGLAKNDIFNEPAYSPDSSKRDTWLAKIVKKEPYLLGILQSVVSIDRNRGWTLVGGKIQVKKFINILHNFNVSPDLFGWRNGFSVSAQNYYQSDLGAVVEIGRSQANGPLAALYTVDPTKCHLTGNNETPLRYNNGPRDKQLWNTTDYFRVTSFPSPTEQMNGLGYCAISRCLELAKLLVSVFEHDREKLGSKAPKGILTINGGLTLAQWLDSLEESTAELKALEREYYTGVQVLVGDAGSDIKVEFTPLSTLPDQFDQQKFATMIIGGYALAFGYDPREFWSMSEGTLGSGNEAKAQHRKASSKGGLDFVLGFQEKIQAELPETLEFEFEQRDVEGDIAEVEFRKAQLDVINEMWKSTNAGSQVMISYPEVRQLLVEAKLIHGDWTIEDEEVQVTDTDDMGEVLEKESVQRAIEKFPKDEIVRYSSTGNKFKTLLRAGEERKKKFYSMRAYKSVKTTAAPEDLRIMVGGTEVKRWIHKDGFISIPKEVMKARAYYGDYAAVRDQFWEATYTVVRDYLSSDERATAFKSAMKRNVVEAYGPAAEAGYIEGGSELPLDDDINEWLTAQQGAELGNVDSLFVSLKMLRDEGGVVADDEASARADGYASSLDGIYNQAAIFGAGNRMLTFSGQDGAVSCATCQSLQGQRHKASWWVAHDFVPPCGSGLDCSAGGRCEHYLEDDDGNRLTL